MRSPSPRPSSPWGSTRALRGRPSNLASSGTAAAASPPAGGPGLLVIGAAHGGGDSDADSCCSTPRSTAALLGDEDRSCFVMETPTGDHTVPNAHPVGALAAAAPGSPRDASAPPVPAATGVMGAEAAFAVVSEAMRHGGAAIVSVETDDEEHMAALPSFGAKGCEPGDATGDAVVAVVHIKGSAPQGKGADAAAPGATAAEDVEAAKQPAPESAAASRRAS